MVLCPPNSAIKARFNERTQERKGEAFARPNRVRMGSPDADRRRKALYYSAVFLVGLCIGGMLALPGVYRRMLELDHQESLALSDAMQRTAENASEFAAVDEQQVTRDAQKEPVVCEPVEEESDIQAQKDSTEQRTPQEHAQELAGQEQLEEEVEVVTEYRRSGGTKCTSPLTLVSLDPFIYVPAQRSNLFVVDAFLGTPNTELKTADLHIELWYSWNAVFQTPSQEFEIIVRGLSMGIVELEFTPTAEGTEDSSERNEQQSILCHVQAPGHIHSYVTNFVCRDVPVPSTSLASGSDSTSPSTRVSGRLRVKNDANEKLGKLKVIPIQELGEIALHACEWDPDIGHTPISRQGGTSAALVTLIKPLHEPHLVGEMRRWVLYHLALGFSHIFIYVDGDVAPIRTTLEPFLSKGLLSVIATRRIEIPWFTTIMPNGPMRANMKAAHASVVFSAHVDRYKSYFSHMAILNMDEYLYVDAPAVGGKVPDPVISKLIDHMKQLAKTASSSESVEVCRETRIAFGGSTETYADDLKNRVQIFEGNMHERAETSNGQSRALFESRSVEDLAYADMRGPQRQFYAHPCRNVTSRGVMPAVEYQYVDTSVAHVVLSDRDATPTATASEKPGSLPARLADSISLYRRRFTKTTGIDRLFHIQSGVTCRTRDSRRQSDSREGRQAKIRARPLPQASHTSAIACLVRTSSGRYCTLANTQLQCSFLTQHSFAMLIRDHTTIYLLYDLGECALAGW
ncbi:hypothetical protein FVE85_3383 [Porphyridium purpureum]|uniref:Glycosyltransferase family 92 protein n=1 Tax=Porphyridium purpureum TaxID=35688 RepID=A0A5J4YWD8_PORPP|nr:hypothetical protein FVE85_3383 [Porphyridium purpureum]|eukprot:POR6252..scf227_4